MARRQTVREWLSSRRGKSSVKVLCGIRGVGKTRTLAAWRDDLIAGGYPEERIVCVDAEEPILRRLVTADDVLLYLSTQLPPSGPVTLLIEEPTSFRDYETALGELLGQRRIDIYLTISSRQLATGGLSDYLRGAVDVYELVPPKEGSSGLDEASSRARWNEILLRDVLPARGVGEANIAERLAAYLVDSVGDPISLRSIGSAISPKDKRFSPNTIEAYLTAFENAYVLERCYLWDKVAEEPFKREYRVFFMDPALCRARFGIAPDFERRTAMNEEWLALRAQHEHVYLTRDERKGGRLVFIGRDGVRRRSL